MARRYRQVVDLYTTGEVLTLKDGTTVWVQPLNPFEADTARNEAQIAKTRISLAIREIGNDERERVKLYYFEDGIEGARARLVEAKVTARTPRIFEQIRNDPEWAERMAIIDRGVDETAAPLEDIEEKLLLKITNEYALELGRLMDVEKEYQEGVYADYDDEALWEVYLAWYIERRAGERMMSEYRLHQVLFGVRWCDGSQLDGVWDHGPCKGHVEPMFENKDAVRSAPEELLDVLFAACDTVDMTAREAKNSDRQGSSSDSSPLPSVAVESTASIPDEIPVAPPGSSPSPSDTRSPSLAGKS